MEDLNRLAIKEEKRADIQRMLKYGLDPKAIMTCLNLTEDEFLELSTPLAG